VKRTSCASQAGDPLSAVQAAGCSSVA